MPSVFNWSVSKLKMYGVVWFNVDGVMTPYVLDIISAQLNWGINTIPTAQVLLAAGREVTTGLPANIHYLVDAFKLQLPFQLYVRAVEYASSYGVPVEQWPPDPFLVFEGYTSGTGFAKSRSGRVSYSLSLVHWLADMSFSSCLSRTVNALSPSQLSKAAGIFGGFGVNNNFVANTAGDSYFSAANVQADFWGLGLRPWLNQVCAQDILTDPDDPVLQNPVNKSNFEATRALNRFEPLPLLDNGVPELDRLGNPRYQPYRYGRPLQLDPLQVLGFPEAVQAIADDVATETFEGMASQTLWDKLVTGYAGNYLYAVVPLVQSALVVPFQPGLRDVWQTIFAEEYEDIEFHGDTPRALRGVRIYGGLGDQFGAFGLAQGAAGDQTSIGGAFDNPNLTDGMLRYLNAPRWMSNIVDPNVFGQQAIAPGGVGGAALFPGAGLPLVGPRPGDIRRAARPLLNLFAQAVYVNEVTQDRAGVLRGRLRFDIAPGSSVQVMINEERFVDLALGKLGPGSMFGTVRRLTHQLDAEGPSASTTFDVGWLRSAMENTLDGTSVLGHPLWAIQWFGAPNVEGFDPVPGQAAALGWGG